MVEGELIHEFFINGEYRNTIRMCIFQHQHLAGHKPSGASLLNQPRSSLRGFILSNTQSCFDGVLALNGGFDAVVRDRQIAAHRIIVAIVVAALRHVAQRLIV